MKKIFALFLLAGIFVSYPLNATADGVTISGRQILVNVSLYTIKKICYNPVPQNSDKVSFSNLTEDLGNTGKLIKQKLNLVRWSR